MSDTELNISQLIFLLQILRYKLESKLFDLEYKMKELCGETISPQFGEYIYIFIKLVPNLDQCYSRYVIKFLF